MEYTDEVIANPDGFYYDVLDLSSVDFAAAIQARKITTTTVRDAEPREEIVTRNNGKIESTYITKGGEAIFVNSPDDVYVPGNPNGSRWQFNDLISKGYEIVQNNDDGSITVKNTKTFSILHEVIMQPTCIKDAWGSGQHQFLVAGATLKLNDNGSITGIDKTAFDKTWEIVRADKTTPAGKLASAPAPTAQ